jgi:polyhydroxyalkanoate synthesis repressor PhaR
MIFSRGWLLHLTGRSIVPTIYPIRGTGGVFQMAEEPEGTPKRLEIRKYPNRRYYDSTRSRHVTLEEIYAAIRDGYEVQITDSRTEQDITAKVLGQIIVDLDSPKLGAFPVPLLHRLLRSNEQLVNDFVHKYNQALSAFLDSQRSVEQYLRNAMGVHVPSPTVADWAKLMWGPFNPALWSQQQRPHMQQQPTPLEPPTPASPAPAPQPQEAAPQSAAPPPASNGANDQQLRQQVDDLRQQIEYLQSQLASQLSNGKKKSRPRMAS